MNLRPVWTIQWIPGYPRLQLESPSLKTKAKPLQNKTNHKDIKCHKFIEDLQGQFLLNAYIDLQEQLLSPCIFCAFSIVLSAVNIIQLTATDWVWGNAFIFLFAWTMKVRPEGSHLMGLSLGADTWLWLQPVKTAIVHTYTGVITVVPSQSATQAGDHTEGEGCMTSRPHTVCSLHICVCYGGAGAGNRFQGFAHTRQVLCCWATFSAHSFQMWWTGKE